ncbi:MAG: site-specific DNA-methyltransferase [Roseiflexus sp.]|nr:site-specific DNA-methyltransferase [Roseiflexus sp.]
MTVDNMTSRINRIIQADCLQELASLPDDSIDLTLFSPPYDEIRDYKKNWSFNFSKLGCQLYRVTKSGGVAIVVIGDGTRQFAKSLTSFRLAVNWVDEIGWKLFECVIYHRDGNPGAWWTQRFRVDHEYILIFFKGDRPKTFQKDHLMVPSKHAGKIYSGTDRLTNGGFKRITPKAVNPLKCRGTVWQYATSNTEGNRLKLLHPATFPDKLAEDLILCFSRPGDVVLDPMCGSGTTCVVARNNDRQYIGIEISEEYCEIARRRLEKEFQPAEQRTMFQEESL